MLNRSSKYTGIGSVYPAALLGLLLQAGTAGAGAPVPSITFDCLNDGSNCPSFISDLEAPVQSTITVPSGACPSGSIDDVNVRVELNHTWLGDLEIDVEHNGTTVRLMDNQCGFNEDMDVSFDDEGGPIVCATPTGGAATPVSPLAPFDGGNETGAWTLTIADNAFLDEGELINWSLDITCTPPPQPVPALSLWGLLTLLGVLGISGGLAARRFNSTGK